MILNFFFWVIMGAVMVISLLLPNYSALPMPQWVYDNAANIFGTMKLLFDLPILRKLVEYFWLWFPVWLLMWQWNFVLKVISLVPWLSGLSKFRIKQDKE